MLSYTHTSLNMTENSSRHAFETLNLLCEWEECSTSLTHIEDFILHIIQDHLGKLCEDELHCHWKDCEGFTENLSELRRHILLHAFHTKIKCHGRNLQIVKKIPDCSLSIHSRNIIPELPEPLVCSWDNCLEEFECPEYFYRHVDYHCESESRKENVSCVLCVWQGCSRSFSGSHKLKEHLRSHTQEKLIACPTCGGMFASRTKFYDHIQRQLPVDENDPDNTFICEYCSRKLNSERLLRDHMRHHVNHYKCMYCDMTCTTPSALQLHVAYRHSDNKPHACQYCDYRCKTESDLRKHLETHSQVPSYKCPVEGCLYATRSQTCYRAHYSKKHEGKQSAKYSCHLCEKVCTRGNYLTKHLINHHKFRWPSGHCRFRYRMHEDGLYRLQTVRYESLELSQTMMGESGETMDAPNGIMEEADESSIDEPNPICAEPSLKSGNNVIIENDSPAIPEPLLLYLKEKNEVQLLQSTPVITEPSGIQFTEKSNTHESESEPVLINIVDTEDGASESGGSVLLIKTTRPISTDQRASVQLITKDSSGQMLLETAEIITQYQFDSTE